MRVIATAGHVDHGKSALVRALTGMEPDRWAEERRRGLTIDLGFAWTELDPGEPVAFVDVPGHQRFVTNMLAGVGPVPAVLFVVAADEGWSRQSSEHLDALHALGISRSVLAVTKADLVEDGRAAAVAEDARTRLSRAGLVVDEVTVSARNGQGLDELRAALRRVLAGLPAPRTDGRVRLWIDRVFSVRGAGTVVTGTLGSGALNADDELAVNDRRYAIRSIEQLERPVTRAEAVSRVAVNLRGADRAGLERGDCLITPGAWPTTTSIDVMLEPLFAEPVGGQMLHLGSASVPVRVRLLTDRTARLTLAAPLPLEVGDRAVLRDPGQQSVTAGVLVLDPDPPALNRRGDARRRGDELRSGQAGSTTAQVARRGAVRASELVRLGFPLSPSEDVRQHGDWLVHVDTWQVWQRGLIGQLDAQTAANPQQPWLSFEAARRSLAIPDPELLRVLVVQAELVDPDGRISRPGITQSLGRATDAVQVLVTRLAANPLDAPERTELSEAGLTARDLATAERTGLLLRLAPDLVVAPTAVDFTLRALADLDQPFTLSTARQRLGTTRRIAVPLLELLDRRGHTALDGDGRRRLIH